MGGPEDEHLEFKKASHNFDSRKLARYCSALANEGGGKIILGVTDRLPRRVVGTQAFQSLERTKAGLIAGLQFRIDAEEISDPGGRVLVFHVPAHLPGKPVAFEGAYWMRRGDQLVSMTPDMLKRIFDETQLDFSAETCRDADLTDLDPEAIDNFRAMWRRKSGNTQLESLSAQQLLTDAELLAPGGITYAALVLLGTARALGRHLPDAEVVFEYRAAEPSVRYSQRREYREGFLLYRDDLWAGINARNDVQHFQEGLFVWDIPAFNEAVVREAVLNAVTHRDYLRHESVFIRQLPASLEIVSPGGFPEGVTAENILWKQSWRNRRLAEAFAKCGLVERSGQGADMMFGQCIREGKRTPDYADSDEFQVVLRLSGDVQDPRFLRFMEQVAKEKAISFATEDLVVLDAIHRETHVPERLEGRLPALLGQGLLEKTGRGRGTRYILSRRFYGFLRQKGVYTRKRGLDREANKQLLLKHLQDNRDQGSQLGELRQVLPHLTRGQVRGLLRVLRKEGCATCQGRTRAARWYPT